MLESTCLAVGRKLLSFDSRGLFDVTVIRDDGSVVYCTKSRDGKENPRKRYIPKSLLFDLPAEALKAWRGRV